MKLSCRCLIFECCPSIGVAGGVQAAAGAGHRAGAAAGRRGAAEARHPGGGGEVNRAV